MHDAWLLLVNPGVALDWCPRAATNDHRLSGLKHQELIPSEFWRPDVRNQGVDRTMFPLTAAGRNPCCLLQLLGVAGNPSAPRLSLSPRGWLLPWVSVCCHLLLRTPVGGAGPTLIWNDLNLHRKHICKDPVSQGEHFLIFLWARNFGGHFTGYRYQGGEWEWMWIPQTWR